MKDKIKELREFLNELQHTIEQGNGATESELKQWWNDISGIITDFEHNPKSDELVEALIKIKKAVHPENIQTWDNLLEDIDNIIEQALKQKGVKI